MFKRYIIILSLLFAFAYVPIYADDCTDGLTEAKALYNSGNYQKAKELFEYVKSECPQNYTEASNWIAKCNDALKPNQSTTTSSSNHKNATSTAYLKVAGSSANTTKYLMNSSSSITIGVSCSGSYSVSNVPSWCSITNKTSTSFVLNYTANPYTYTRYGSIDVSGGGTSIRISLEQAAKVSSNSSTTTTTSSSLKVNKTLVVATAKGVTDYITVTCNKAWEIQYPSGGMYTATRSGNSVKVVISTNTTTSQRTDFFNIRTTDGKETIKISLSQSGQSSKSSYNNYSNSKRSNNAYNSKHSLSKYQQYARYCGDYEITWGGIRAGIGTGAFYGVRVFSFRLGPVQINPAELTFDYGFIKKPGYYISDYYHDHYYDKVWVEDYNVFNMSYTPSIDFFIPFQDDAAFYFGGGPSIVWSSDPQKDWPYVWADVSAGIHWHWGYSASSDFFVRYNGNFMIGVSIQWSTDY